MGEACIRGAFMVTNIRNPVAIKNLVKIV